MQKKFRALINEDLSFDVYTTSFERYVHCDVTTLCTYRRDFVSDEVVRTQRHLTCIRRRSNAMYIVMSQRCVRTGVTLFRMKLYRG